MAENIWTVKICKESTGSGKEPDFKSLSTPELNQIYLKAQEIMARVQTMLAQRG